MCGCAVSVPPLAVVQKLVFWACSILSLDLPSQAPPAVNVRLIKAACKTVAVISKLGGSSVTALLVNLVVLLLCACVTVSLWNACHIRSVE